MAVHESHIVAVRSALQQLSKHRGLTPERLRTTEIDGGTLFALPAVQHRRGQLGGDEPEALISVVRELAQRLLATDRIIVDVELALRLFDTATVPNLDRAQLYGNELGTRRAYLVEHWDALHVAAGADDVPPIPTVRSLRATPERNAFTALARALAAGTAVTIVPAIAPVETRSRATRPVVTIIGDAVIDEVLRCERIPEPRRSTRSDRERIPGGKALYRAVAAARLGLDVRLLAAVGDDADGREILGYLQSENVDTELVRVVSDAPTSVVTVVIDADGVRSLVHKHPSTQCTEEHLRSPAVRAALAASSAVLLTFEQPGEIVELVLETIRTLRVRPIVLLHPAPADEPPRHLHRFLGLIDHLIGSPYELERVAQETGSAADTISRLRLLGVHSVCALEDFQASVHSDAVTAHIHRPSVGLEDTPSVRAVFSAALAYRFVTGTGPATEQDFRWAVAAMVAAHSGFATLRGAELIGEIDRIVRFAEEHHPGELLGEN
ncbi:ribokinase [Nocardia tenerifensis]|uniref:Ribokinase n=1 Tax=Nocardia tenerifensis TaxID=228006 RepID=A0A318KB21_9NOCA|nr:carbohydrate kinase family protein [Nocardia tenerifensis]PXX71087.1 ribokinase [Nocardia tenerifensis]